MVYHTYLYTMKSPYISLFDVGLPTSIEKKT